MTFFTHRLSKSSLALLAILALFMITRLYNLENRITFGWDQENFSTQIWNIVKNHNFTLLGPRTNNDLGFFLAPYFTYLLIPFFIFTKMHPFALYYFLVVVSVLFFVAAYVSVSRIFSQKHALFFLTLWTLNPLTHMYDGVPWWPVLIPLGVMIVLGMCHYIYKHQNNISLWLVLGIALGFFSNMHFQFVFMVFCASVFASYMVKKKKTSWNAPLSMFVGFFITLTPLILFDIRHDFMNTKLFFNFFFTKTDTFDRDIFVWILPYANFLKSFTIWPLVIFMQVFWLAVLGSMMYMFRHTKEFQKLFYGISMTLWIGTLIFFGLYGKRPSEYYFIYLMPFIFITFIDISFRFQKEVPLLLVSLLLALVHFPWFQKTVQTDYAGLKYKERVLDYIDGRMKDKEFFISYDGVSIDNGFHYLIKYKGMHISEDPHAPLIEVTLPPREGFHMIGKYGVTPL